MVPDTRAAEAAARAQFVDEIVAARYRRKRAALLQMVFGLALLLTGVTVTLTSHGQLIWYGAAVAGMLTVMRGTVALARSALSQD